ncbi:MAG: hypothetical protein CM15mP18_4550 [Methanobacteriota archaeon]|nr:MAG: hypothetical protein CM15mP18_4550 [Euryarchaeota archaeon]
MRFKPLQGIPTKIRRPRCSASGPPTSKGNVKERAAPRCTDLLGEAALTPRHRAPVAEGFGIAGTKGPPSRLAGLLKPCAGTRHQTHHTGPMKGTADVHQGDHAQQSEGAKSGTGLRSGKRAVFAQQKQGNQP